MCIRFAPVYTYVLVYRRAMVVVIYVRHAAVGGVRDNEFNNPQQARTVLHVRLNAPLVGRWRASRCDRKRGLCPAVCCVKKVEGGD